MSAEFVAETFKMANGFILIEEQRMAEVRKMAETYSNVGELTNDKLKFRNKVEALGNGMLPTMIKRIGVAEKKGYKSPELNELLSKIVNLIEDAKQLKAVVSAACELK